MSKDSLLMWNSSYGRNGVAIGIFAKNINKRHGINDYNHYAKRKEIISPKNKQKV